MNHETLTQHLSTLITKWENEVIEFKLAGSDYKTDKIGESFSALANEAFRTCEIKEMVRLLIKGLSRFRALCDNH